MQQNYKFEERILPMIPLRGLTVFPGMIVHFDVGREKSIGALEEAMENGMDIFLVSQKDITQVDNFSTENLYNTGTVCSIKQILRLPGNNARVLAEGIKRGVLSDIIETDKFNSAKVNQVVEEADRTDDHIAAAMRNVSSAFEEYVGLESAVSPEVLVVLKTLDDPVKFSDLVCGNLLLKQEESQQLLEVFDVADRLELIYQMIVKENRILKIKQKLSRKVRKEMNKNERDYYLREQIKAIQSELGDEDAVTEAEEYMAKLEKLELSDETREKITKEIKKYSRSSRTSADGEVSRNYLETFFDLPWNVSTQDKIDLVAAQEILDKDHYGLEKVKERIIEFLAVKKLSNSMKGPIICLVGPPGVGKTSIARSVAKAMNRNFERISLGGVRDEAEILGHRRTYIGAIPGRIINALTLAKSNNPVILFDEIDKMSNDFRGDPASALLEVFDSEQNENFTDHYMEVSFDLSKVLFITTANTLSTIPLPLIDRMEVIEVTGYTEQEKLEIAKRYLIPKQLKENALSEKFLSISDETLMLLISKWTRESGVRNLERQIGKICRKLAKRKVDNPKLRYVKVTNNTIEKYLGKQIFDYEMMSEKPQIGIVRGLAWTQAGGVTLSIEVNTMEGSGKLVLTGQLGDVMQESAKTALSFVRSVADKYNVKKDFYKTLDIHMHIPEGATPKDGPSAGITMATAILSAISHIPVRNDIAMTGEITLRGRVLPIGGVKEKLLAAHRAGIDSIILPAKNEKDLEDLPEEVRKKMKITLADNMEQVLDTALVKDETAKAFVHKNTDSSRRFKTRRQNSEKLLESRLYDGV